MFEKPAKCVCPQAARMCSFVKYFCNVRCNIKHDFGFGGTSCT